LKTRNWGTWRLGDHEKRRLRDLETFGLGENGTWGL